MLLKKKFILFVFIIPLSVFSQKTFKAGLTAGLSATQYDGDTYSGYNKPGLMGGGFVTSKVNDKIDWEFNIIYIQKGARKLTNQNTFSQYLLYLDYIEIPVYAKFNFKSFVISAGLGFGTLIRKKEIANNLDITGIRPFSKTEFSFQAGISYPLGKRFEINWRYSYSILPVRPHASGAVHYFNRGEYNNVLAFALRYNFGKDEQE